MIIEYEILKANTPHINLENDFLRLNPITPKKSHCASSFPPHYGDWENFKYYVEDIRYKDVKYEIKLIQEFGKTHNHSQMNHHTCNEETWSTTDNVWYFYIVNDAYMKYRLTDFIDDPNYRVLVEQYLD